MIDSAKPSDSAALITAAADNVVLSNLTAIVIALGIIMTTYGMYVVQACLRGSGNGESLALAGFLLLLFGNVGWVMAQGLTLIAADAQSPQAIEAMAPVYSVRLGLILMPGLAIALGFFVFSLALSARPGFNKIAAWIVALVYTSVVRGELHHRNQRPESAGRGAGHSQSLLRRLGGLADHAWGGPAEG